MQHPASAVALQVGDTLSIAIGRKIITAQGRINLRFADGSVMHVWDIYFCYFSKTINYRVLFGIVLGWGATGVVSGHGI